MIPFVKPDISDAEIEAVVDVLRSGWITTGPVTKAFEKDLAAYFGTDHVALVGSQTFGAEIVLRALGIGPGDEVIVPAYTYTATCSVIYHVGATPVMIDSQVDHPEMDYDAMEAAITPRTKVIIPVDIAGLPCDYDRIYEAIRRKQALFTPHEGEGYMSLFDRVVILADTAHSLGGQYQGKMSGNVADFSSFSLHAVKNLTTAEGGAVTWRQHEGLVSDAFYEQLMLLSLHGQTKDALKKDQAGAWEYDIVAPLYKGNMTDLAAAIGRTQLTRYDSMLARRKAIIHRYDEAFAELPVTPFSHDVPGRVSSGHLYFIRLDGFDEEARNAFIREMVDDGISCNVHYKPLPMLTAYKDRGFDIKDYPHAYHYYENLVSLPLYSTLTDEQVETVIAAVRRHLTH